MRPALFASMLLVLLTAGAGAFYLAEFGSWTLAYTIMALLIAIAPVIARVRHDLDELDDSERCLAAADRLLAWLVGRDDTNE